MKSSESWFILLRAGLLLCLLASSLGRATGAATDNASCQAFLATHPNPPGVFWPSRLSAQQRSSFLAAGGKLIPVDETHYYAVWVPSSFHTAAKKIVIVNLHGTGGYAEAEWSDWHSQFADRGYAFLGLSWGAGTPTVWSDEVLYSRIKELVGMIKAHCPFDDADSWLQGFSVGSAASFAVIVRDVADLRLFRGQIAASGSTVSPMTSGMLMFPTVEAAKSNPSAVRGIRSWMYCGDRDNDHGWSMCEEMPQGEDFINTHGGSAYLYRDPTGTHHGLPGNANAYNSMFAFIEASTRAPFPKSGWWWNPQESGRGFTLEVSGNVLFLVAYLYDATGHATWHISAGRFFADGSYRGSLDAYAGGQVLTLDYQPATLQGSVGDLALACDTEDHCTLQWPGGTVPIERAVWDTTPSPSSAPETGWWWNSSENGRGFYLEQQGGTLVASAFLYEADGRAVWYLANAQESAGRYTGQWQQYGQGQTLTGTYRPATLVNANVGSVSLWFTDPQTGTLVLPGGRELSIERLPF